MDSAASAAADREDSAALRRLEDELHASELRARMVAESSAALGQSLDPDDTLRTLARKVVGAIADLAVCYRVSEDGRVHRACTEHADAGLQPLVDELAGLSPPTRESPDAVATALRTGRTIHIPHLDARTVAESAPSERHIDLARRLRPRSIAVVPLKARGRVLGAMSAVTVEDGKPPLGEPECRLLEDIAAHAGLALDTARLLQAEQRARRDAEVAVERTLRLQAVTAALSRALPRSEVLDVIIREAVAATGASAGAVVELTEDRQEFVLLTSAGFDPETVRRYQRFPADLPMPLSEATRSAQPVLVGSVAEWTARYPEPPRRNGQIVDDGAWAVLPLLSGDRIFGAITLGYDQSRAFGPAVRDFLMALANQCAQALERGWLFESERRARAEAEEANLAKTRFLSSMSHELRTPLNAIGGFIELVGLGIYGPVTDAQAAALGRITANQRHLLTLINEVLNFARLEAGQISYHVTEFAVQDALADMEDLIEPLVRSRGLDYSYRPPGPALRMRGDRDKVRQIVLNLLTNAIKFTPSGGRIRLLCEPGDGDVLIHVEDDGCGIAPDKHDAIFDAFVQIERNSGDPQQGVGLGLSISRDLARGMGGDLSVRSDVGQGSVFTVRLPSA